MNTDRLSDTDPDSTGATPLLPLAPPPLKLCLHTLLLQWKGPVSSLLSVLSSSLRLAGVIVVVACGGSGGNSEKNDRNAVQLLASLLYGLWFACSDAAMTSLWTPKRLLTTSRLSCMSTSFAMWLFFKMTSSCKSAKSKFSLLEQLSSFWSSCWVFFLSRCDGSLMPNEECFFVLFFLNSSLWFSCAECTLSVCFWRAFAFCESLMYYLVLLWSRGCVALCRNKQQLRFSSDSPTKLEWLEGKLKFSLIKQVPNESGPTKLEWRSHELQNTRVGLCRSPRPARVRSPYMHERKVLWAETFTPKNTPLSCLRHLKVWDQNSIIMNILTFMIYKFDLIHKVQFSNIHEVC